MKKLIVLNPEGAFVSYFIYASERSAVPNIESVPENVRSGRIRLNGPGVPDLDIARLLRRHAPHAVAVRVLYGGDRFKEVEHSDESLIDRLRELTPASPLNIPAVVRLLEKIGRTVPTPEIMLFFETAFFNRLPVCERTYAIDADAAEILGESELRRYGYHGIFHRAAVTNVVSVSPDTRRILSVCLEPQPEVVGIYDGKPVTVSSGSTPVEGLPGNTTCGEIDPGIILFLQEKMEWGPEKINDMLTRKSGLSALAGEPVTVEDVLRDGGAFEPARKFFEYRLLLSCGAAVGAMNGVDAIVFSGRYSAAGEKLSERLVSSLQGASDKKEDVPVFFLRHSIDRIIAESAFMLLDS
jgi:acetate kinase